MKKLRPIITRNAHQLAQALGLHPSEGAPFRLRSELNTKIIHVVAHKKLTHAQVARLSQTSRTRITAILNRNTTDISPPTCSSASSTPSATKPRPNSERLTRNGSDAWRIPTPLAITSPTVSRRNSACSRRLSPRIQTLGFAVFLPSIALARNFRERGYLVSRVERGCFGWLGNDVEMCIYLALVLISTQ